MKHLLAGFLLVTLAFSPKPTQAAVINCDDYQGDIAGASLLVIDWLQMNCHSKSEYYHVEMLGVGPGLRLDGHVDGVQIVCPLVRKRKLAGHYAGVKVSAGVMKGVNVAVMTNARLGVCLLYGITSTLGGSVSIDYINIESNGHLDDEN